jgi:hypothetical protein
MAKTKRVRTKKDTGELIVTAFSHSELLVTAAAIKLAEKSGFTAPQSAALKRVFAKIKDAHVWQSQSAKTGGK